MKSQYIFHEGDFPAACHVRFSPALFNRIAYGEIQSQTGWCSFYILREDEVCGGIRFCIVDGVAKSPLRAPFGSLDLMSEIPPRVVFDFLAFVERRLQDLGASRIEVKNPPDVYDPERMTLLANFFLTHQYSITDAEVGAVIAVSSDPFSEQIHPRKKRKLVQSRVDSLQFVKLERKELPDVYAFIAACRWKKNYKLSIALDELGRFVDRFPDEYVLFGVFHGHALVAASVVIRVHEHALYHFISDHVPHIGELRPALILMEGIYEYCLSEGISLLDLGTSTLDGKPDVKLLRFKKEIGGQLTHKFSFQKNLR